MLINIRIFSVYLKKLNEIDSLIEIDLLKKQ